MALRIRANGDILCAAKHPALPGDAYIDDQLHYDMAVVLRWLAPDEDENKSGRWHWAEKAPPKVKNRN